MNVIYATDENYAMYTGISVYSLFENNADMQSLIVHIIDNNISNESKCALSKIAEEFNRKIIFYDAKKMFENLAKKIKMKNTQTITTYASCFLAKMLGEEIEKALYVDGDSLFLGSLKELEELDMSDYYIAGCLDTCLPEVRKAIGFKKEEPYINAGFLYMNFKKIREDDLDEKIFTFIEDIIPTSLHNDQDVVNGVLGKKMKVLPVKYCLLTPLYEKKYKDIVKFFELKNYYSEEEVIDSKEHPIFIHFTPSATKRPWVLGCKHPQKNKWNYYKEKTFWRDVEDKKDNRTFKVKILNWLFINTHIRIYKMMTNIYLHLTERLKKNE